MDRDIRLHSARPVLWPHERIDFAISPDGEHLYLTLSGNVLDDAKRRAQGEFSMLPSFRDLVQRATELGGLAQIPTPQPIVGMDERQIVLTIALLQKLLQEMHEKQCELDRKCQTVRDFFPASQDEWSLAPGGPVTTVPGAYEELVMPEEKEPFFWRCDDEDGDAHFFDPNECDEFDDDRNQENESW